jgi:hypothetical protein
MNSLIFLDIDGVLNSIDLTLMTRSLERQPKHRLFEVDPVRVGVLKWIVDMTDAHIVISSTWRHGNTEDWFVGYFEGLSWVNCPIAGMTPETGNSFRGDQIKQYLDHEEANTRYVILDDDSDFYPDQNFVHVDRCTGLTLKHAIACVDLLGLADEENRRSVEGLRDHATFKRDRQFGEV